MDVAIVRVSGFFNRDLCCPCTAGSPVALASYLSLEFNVMADSDKKTVTVKPVGIVRSPFTEKFATPRQSGLVEEAVGEIELYPEFSVPGMLDALEGFSHLWVIFQFDRCVDQGWRPRVRPPRLGGNREVGVWASRAPFRPNHLGLSVVRLLDISTAPVTRLRVAGLDMTDGTPVFDIKPYLPYADCVPDATGGFAASRPGTSLDVSFSLAVTAALDEQDAGGNLRDLIRAVIALDPRPAYREGAEPDRVYGATLAGYDVRWRVGKCSAEVIEITPAG